MKTIIYSDDGAVSVYLIIVTAAIFMFNAVIIDFVRIKVAEKEFENAINAALRSTLSSYDNGIRKYGLFGLGLTATQETELLNNVLRENLSTGPSKDTFHFIDFDIKGNAAQVVNMYSLADHFIFERQIMEEMKYKAPLEFTRNLVHKFSGITDQVDSAVQFTEQASAVESLIQKREAQLEHAWETVGSMTSAMEQLHDKYERQLQKLRVLQEGPENPQEESESRMKERGSMDSFLESLEKEAIIDTAELNEIKRRLDSHLQEAKNYDRNIEQQLRSFPGSDKSPAAAPPDSREVFQYVELLGDFYFTLYETDAAKVISFFGSFSLNVSNGTGMSPDKLEELNSIYYREAQHFYNVHHAEFETRQKKYAVTTQMKNDRKKTVQEQVDQVKGYTTDSCGNSDAPTYTKLSGRQGLYYNYLHFNDKGDELNELNTDPSLQLENNPEQLGKISISLLSGLKEVTEQLTQELYVNEYALMHFNYRTFEEEGDNADSFKPQLSDHSLSNQEVEYIIYGFSSCKGNLYAAYAELFVARLAVRTIEALTDPKKAAMGSPMLVFLTALSEGAIKARGDMQRLIRGEAVPLTDKFSSLKLTYKDYLRLFLFFHSQDSRKMSRMQALIHENTSRDLREKQTYIQVNARASIRLWFVPGLTRTLSFVGILDGRVDGNRYEIIKNAGLSYE